jgi:hypothetical protein
MQEVKSYLEIGRMLETLNLAQKQKFIRKAKTFYSERGKKLHTGTRQQIMQMFNHLRSKNYSKGAT